MYYIKVLNATDTDTGYIGQVSPVSTPISALESENVTVSVLYSREKIGHWATITPGASKMIAFSPRNIVTQDGSAFVQWAGIPHQRTRTTCPYMRPFW